MENCQTIRGEILVAFNSKMSSLGLTDTAVPTQAQLDQLTDAVAAKLETVNPTTTYPPTGR